MAAPRITPLSPAAVEPRLRTHQQSSPDVYSSYAWPVLALAGWVFLFVGLVDLGLAWTLPRFGNVDWEFATVSATLNNLPVPTMGFALLLAAAAGRGARWQLAALAVGAVVGALLLIGMGGLYALNVPIALDAVTEPLQRQTLRTTLVKAVSSLVGYFAFYLASVVVAVRARRSVPA